MPRFVGAGWVVLATLMVTNLWAQELEEPINIDEKATHEQAKLIEIPKESPVNAFCLDAKGQILAACGAGPGEVKVLDAMERRSRFPHPAPRLAGGVNGTRRGSRAFSRRLSSFWS